MKSEIFWPRKRYSTPTVARLYGIRGTVLYYGYGKVETLFELHSLKIT